MKKLLTLFLLLSATASYAQNSNPLRDSLRQAMDVLAYHPDSIDLRLRKASWNLELQQWDAAKQEYDYVLSRQPDNVAALYYRAYVNEKLKRYNFARIDYENMLDLTPGNFNGMLGLALLNQKDMHYTEAYDQINELVERFPDNPVAYAARAGIEKERDMKELAAYDYAEAIKLDSGNLDYRVNYIDLLITLGRKTEARDAIDETVKLGLTPRASFIDFYKRLRQLP